MQTAFVCDLVSAFKLSDFCEVRYRSVLESCSASVGFVGIRSVIVVHNLCVYMRLYTYFLYFFTYVGEIWYRKFPCNAIEQLRVLFKLVW